MAGEEHRRRPLLPPQLLAGSLLRYPPRPRRAVSSVGRAPPRQGGGHWFEPSTAHFAAQLWLGIGQKARHRLLQDRQIAVHDLQDPLDADPEVLVRDQVAQRRDVAPGNLWCLGTGQSANDSERARSAPSGSMSAVATSTDMPRISDASRPKATRSRSVRSGSNSTSRSTSL